MKKRISFVALSLAAPSAFLLVYRTYAWSESFAMASLTVGVIARSGVAGLVRA